MLPALCCVRPAGTLRATNALPHLLGLQEEGKKLKKFAEKKMRDGRPTHVSSMFLCQARDAGAGSDQHPCRRMRPCPAVCIPLWDRGACSRGCCRVPACRVDVACREGALLPAHTTHTSSPGPDLACRPPRAEPGSC